MMMVDSDNKNKNNMANNTVEIRDFEVYKDFKHNDKNYKDVVKTVHFTVISGETGASYDGSLELDEKVRSFKNFTNFENLTKNKVIGWVTDNVDWDEINEVLSRPEVINKKPNF